MKKLYRSLMTRPVILLMPVPIFLLLFLVTSMNGMYCGIAALALGATATVLYRPDLVKKMCIQGVFFLLLCLFYYGGMLLFFPDYVGTYKSSSITAAKRPEELLLIISAGLYWSGLFNVCTTPAADYSTAS